MNNDQKRAMLAVVLSGIVLFSWQLFFAPKHQKAAETTANEVKEVKEVKAVVKTDSTASTKTETVAKELNLNEVKSITLRNGNHTAVIRNNFSIESITGFDIRTTVLDFSGDDNFFEVKVVDSSNNMRAVNLAFETINDETKVSGHDVNLGLKVDFRLDNDGRVLYNMTFNSPSKVVYKFTSKEKQSANQTYRQFIYFTQDVERINVESEERSEGKMKWVGLDFNHHLFANVLNNKASFKFNSNEKGNFYAESVDKASSYEGYLIYSLKSYDYLATYKDQLDLSVDFGIFGILAVPILKGLQYFYKYLGNYGFAIILLTFLIRFLTFPLQFKSFKSMKKMQKVQPELTKLKEKFKDNPQRMQKETMELFKRAGANPLGGCLPMLLQVPIFIAFYQAINNSVELVGSPFLAWLVDLSTKDPYYILPVLMGVTMFAQTKLNPSTTADPTQQKVMYIMPLVFCFIMKDLPSGLLLYFVISNIVGIGQQLLVYKMVD